MMNRVTQNTEKEWDVLDRIAIEVAAELGGEDFESEIDWTPELLEVKETLMAEFKNKPHTTIDFVN